MATERLDSELEELVKELEAFEEEDELFEDSFGDDEIEGMEDLGATVSEDRFDDDFLDAGDEEDPFLGTNDGYNSKDRASGSSGKRPFLLLVAITILIGGMLGGGALWLVSDPPEDLIAFIEQFFKDDQEEPDIVDLQEETSSELADTSSSELAAIADTLALGLAEEQPRLPEKIEETEPTPRIKKNKYFVQVARCLDQECVEDYRRLLKQNGLRSNVVTKVENTSIFEVVSRLTFDAFKAAQWAKHINESYHVTGEAFRQREGEQYRISMGLFPDHKTAEHVHSGMNLKFAGQLQFDIKTIQQKTLYHLIRTRSFESRQQAVALQNRLMEQEEQFDRVWIITTTHYL